ncbi:MAG: flagellar basal body P-ring formation protein FlgA [Alphaproteobacteria bacterium]|nr:flagellar basal body P-ring formation protein FlgA [Alphaproteobacteria bacterium]
MRAFLIATVLVLAAATAALADPVLRPQVTVEHDVVQLGDLFGDLPRTANPAVEVARAPAPGHKVTLDAAALMNIATANRIGWRPNGRFDKAVIERAGQVIAQATIHDAILRALAEHGVPAGAEVSIDNAQPVVVPADKPAAVRAENPVYDPAKPRFEITLVTPADDRDGGERSTKITGKVFRMVDMPVLVRPIGVGEVIRARDIEMVRLRVDQIAATHVNDPDKLVDKAAKRVLAAGQPVKVSDVAMPLLITKNSMVNVRIASNRLNITMQGKSMDDGAEGDTVRVVNTRSNKIVQGTVNGRGEVVVITSYSLASN